MTLRTPQCKVFWPFNSSSEFSGVPKDSKFPLLGVWASPSHLAQSGVVTPTSRRCTVLRLHHQKGLHKRPKNDPYLQHVGFSTRPQPPKHHKLPNDRQALAQRAPTQGGHAHLADPQLGPSGGHLVTTPGNHSALQSLRLQRERIPTTLPIGMLHGATRLESLQKNLGRMVSTPRHRDHLTFCPPG